MNNDRTLLAIVLKVLLVLAPLLLQILTYLAFDPFEVLWTYEKHYTDKKVAYNRDHISTEILLKNYRKLSYDSFILGSSRSLAFRCREWGKYINAQGVFHYDASGESLYGVYKKVLLLDRLGIPIRNCLIVLDHTLLSKVDNHRGHIAIKHPKVSQESSLDFQMEFLRAFMTPHYLKGYLNYKIRDRIDQKYSDIFMQSEVTYDPETNDIFMTVLDAEILHNCEEYYRKMMGVFYKRESNAKHYSDICLKDTQKKYLQDIKMIFDKHGTEYIIIVSPVYDQMSLHNHDIEYLRSLFGEEYVYDYSGINKYTSSICNYYETIHYRPVVAEQILSEIYGE